jgi:hypothetical protein
MDGYMIMLTTASIRSAGQATILGETVIKRLGFRPDLSDCRNIGRAADMTAGSSLADKTLFVYFRRLALNESKEQANEICGRKERDSRLLTAMDARNQVLSGHDFAAPLDAALSRRGKTAEAHAF